MFVSSALVKKHLTWVLIILDGFRFTQPDVGRLVSRLFIIEIRSKVVPKDAMKANTGVEIKLHLFVTSALCGDDCSSLTSQANAQIKELSSLNRLKRPIFLSLLT